MFKFLNKAVSTIHNGQPETDNSFTKKKPTEICIESTDICIKQFFKSVKWTLHTIYQGVMDFVRWRMSCNIYQNNLLLVYINSMLQQHFYKVSITPSHCTTESRVPMNGDKIHINRWLLQ